MQKTLLYLFLPILLLIGHPICSLAADDPPPPEDIEAKIDNSSEEELKRFNPSKITEADVEKLEAKLFQTLPHHLGAVQVLRDEYGQKVRNENGKVQKVWVRGPLAKIGHQTRNFPLEAFIFYSAIGATMVTQAYYESKLMDGRTNPDWMGNLYHELTSPVGLFSFYCFLLASGQTGYIYAKGFHLEKRIAALGAQRLAAKEAGKITPAFLKEHHKLQQRLAWHNRMASQLGLAMGIFASNVVTELYYTLQKPAFKHCADSWRKGKDQTLSSQNQALQCDLYVEELWSTVSTWLPGIYSVLSASLISAKLMQWTQTGVGKGAKVVGKGAKVVGKGGAKVVGKIPFIKNLTIKMKESTQVKLLAAQAGKLLIFPARFVVIKITQGFMKFVNLFMFMEIDQQITHKIFDPINKRGHIGAANYLLGSRGAAAVSGGHLGDLRNSIENFTKKYLQMSPDEDSLKCERDNGDQCEYHPVLVSAHQNAQQFSQLRTYLSTMPMAAYNNWLLYINNTISSAIAAEGIYTSLIKAAAQALGINSKSPEKTDSADTDSNKISSIPVPALFNQEHYFISEEDSLADYEPTLINDMRKTQTEIISLEENIAKWEQSLEQHSEETSTSEEVIVPAKLQEIQTISESRKQVAKAKRFNLFNEVLDELREYKNAHNINCQNQTPPLPTVSLGISSHLYYDFLELPKEPPVQQWSDAQRICTLEMMFNIAYSSNVEPFYAEDMASAQQQAEDIISTTMGDDISDAEELRTWGLDLLRKRVLSAGLELLDLISKNKSGEIYYQEHGPSVQYYSKIGEHHIAPSEKQEARIDEMIAQNIFVKLNEKVKAIKSYPRGALYTQKLNDYYQIASETFGYQYTPAFLELNMFRNPRIMDFMLASFLCGQKNELFENAMLSSVPQDLTEGKHWTDIVDERLPALQRSFLGTHHIMNPPRFPFLKLSAQELSRVCTESIQTTATYLGAPLNNRTISFGNTSYPNLLHLVLDNIDMEQLRHHALSFQEEEKQSTVEMLQLMINESTNIYNEVNSSSVEDFIQNHKNFILSFYSEEFKNIEHQLVNEEITQEEFDSQFFTYDSIINKIESGQLAEISWDELNDFKQALSDGIEGYKEALETTQSTSSDEAIAAKTPPELFQIWWDRNITPSINEFIKLSSDEFAAMGEFQFPGPLFQNTVSEIELTSHETIGSYYSESNSQSSEENTSLLAQLFPSLVQNNQLDSFTSVMPFMSASAGFITTTNSSATITSHKNTLTVPEGIIANIHFEMTYWADLILDMAKRKVNTDPNADIDLATLQQQLNTLTDLYDVDKLNYDYVQNYQTEEDKAMEPFDPTERISSRDCRTIDKGTVWGGVKDFFRPIQVSKACKNHYEIFSYNFSNAYQTEDAVMNKCLRNEYLPKKIGEQLGIDTSILYSRLGNSDDEQMISFFTENSIYEDKSSESDTLLDQLLKYALVRLQTVAKEVEEVVDMYWNEKASREENHIYYPPSTTAQSNCEQLVQKCDAFIQFKVEQATEETELAEQAETGL